MVVDKIISDLLGRSCLIQSVMWEEWQQTSKEIVQPTTSPREETKESQNDIVEKAIALFGADLVEVKS